MLKTHCEYCDNVILIGTIREIERTIKNIGVILEKDVHYCSIKCIIDKLLIFYQERNE